MSLYNLSNSNPAETKISDFFAKEFKPTTDASDELSEPYQEEETESKGFVNILSYAEMDRYDRSGDFDGKIIKEEISSFGNSHNDDTEAAVSTIEDRIYKNALSFDALPKFELNPKEAKLTDEEILGLELSDIENLSEEDRRELEAAFHLANARKIIEEMMQEKAVEAEEIIARAEEEAGLMRQTAIHAAEKIKGDAYLQGKAEGYADGYDAGMVDADTRIRGAIAQEVREIKQEVATLIDSVSLEKNLILEQYSEDLTALALSTAEKIVRVSLESSGDIIRGMIMSAAEGLKKTQWLKIYMSKYDFEMLKEADYDLIDSLSFVSDDIKVVVMEESELGTAIIETAQQVIDLSVKTQMDNIRDIIDNAM